MIKRLRRRFIVMTMLALSAVLGTIFLVINVLNYVNTVRSADRVLSILEENGGRFDFPERGEEDMPQKLPSPEGGNLPGTGPGGEAGEIPENRPELPEPPESRENRGMKGRGGLFGGWDIDEETPYETRYFTVKLDQDGKVLEVNTGFIAAVDEETAGAYAGQAAAGKRQRGFIGDYRYSISEGEDRLVIFLDCGRYLSSFRSFLWISLLIGLIGLLAVFVLICIFSGRIIRPISESYEKQKQFITDAGHEIKTPLTIINADAEVLEMDMGQSEWIDDIRMQTKRLGALTKSLIELSRMEEGGAKLEMIEFPVSEAVADAAASFQALAVTQKKEFVCEITPGLTLKGDEKSISQLVSILLDNALKYSPEGGLIRLKLERQGKSIRLSVYNTTSEPVDRASLPRLFDRFYRTDASRSSETGGYGIGLSIARAVTDSHKGKIAAVSADGNSLEIVAVIPGASSEQREGA